MESLGDGDDAPAVAVADCEVTFRCAGDGAKLDEVSMLVRFRSSSSPSISIVVDDGVNGFVIDRLPVFVDAACGSL